MKEVKSNKDIISGYVILAMRLSVLPLLVWMAVTRDYSELLLAVGGLIFMFSPEILQRWIKFRLPMDYSLFLVVFMYAALILGETGGAYERFWWWDAVLHGSSAIVFSFFGFLLLYVAKVQGRLDISHGMFAFLTFSVGMMFGGVWEVFEFSMDAFFGLDMQKSGLVDTMGDLAVDMIGSLITAVATWQFLSNHDKGGYARRLIAWATEEFMDVNPELTHKK